MTATWGRVDNAGTWPNRRPVWTLAALLLALISGLGVAEYRYTEAWTPLQRFYLAAYLRSALASDVGLSRSGRYRLLTIVSRRGRVLALDDQDVEPAVDGAGVPTWALTDRAVRAGDTRLLWQDGQYDHAKLHALLRYWLYSDQSPMDLLAPALESTAGVGLAVLFVAIPKDIARARERRHGRRLRGPELVTVRQFNQRTGATGLGWVQHANVVKRLLGLRQVLRIPRAREASHVLIVGDTGTGKSLIIRQTLDEIEARGETAIVYDPALDYTPQFYRPDRGDVILNPLDTRSPYWTPADELRHDAEALTLATSLFPDEPYETNKFFNRSARRIFAHLLTLAHSPEELAVWLRDDDELDRRLAGTSYAAMVKRDAPQQRSGVVGQLNMVGDALDLLPAEAATRQRWSAKAWAPNRQGWIFLTSTPETRESLKPLYSLWFDLLVLRLMNQGRPGVRPVWFVIDELASLQRLPQLHTAITENRKSHNPVVLGFQSRSQLEILYGQAAETMISQPATKIFLRTSEPEAAKWVSDAIGAIEIERLAESRSRAKAPSRAMASSARSSPSSWTVKSAACPTSTAT